MSVQTGYWSDGLQGRSRLEKPLRKWLDGGEEAMRRLTNVLWCPGRRGYSTQCCAEWELGEDSREGSETDLQHCD